MKSYILLSSIEYQRLKEKQDLNETKAESNEVEPIPTSIEPNIENSDREPLLPTPTQSVPLPSNRNQKGFGSKKQKSLSTINVVKKKWKRLD